MKKEIENISMDELSNYIIDHYNKFMTLKEKAARKHLVGAAKINNCDHEKLKEKLKKMFLSSDPEVIKLTINGYEEFKRTVTERIINEHYEEIFFNLCPKCNALARTPNAKQCPKCYYSWHDAKS